MNLLKQYIKISTVAAIFTEAMDFHYIIDLRVFYMIILSNSVLLLLFKAPKINVWHFLILLFLALHGILTATLYESTIALVIKQLIGITVASIYFYNIFKLFSVKEIFKVYCYISVGVSVLGLLMFVSGITVWDPERLHSILNEPSRYVIIVLPAFFYYIRTRQYWISALLLLCLLLAQSSIGFIGLLLMLIVPNLKMKYLRKLPYLIPFAAIAIYFLSVNENFQLRYRETLEAFSVFETKKFQEQINVSSYALLSNAYVSFNSLVDHPLGAGIGAHEAMHQKYVKELTPPPYLVKQNLEAINSKDANSLFLRMVTDFGILVIIPFGLFAIAAWYAFRSQDHYAIIAQAIFFYLMLKLLRQGHYFSQEFYLFLWFFIFSLKELGLKVTIRK